jgi:hypothetical protein
MGPSTGTFDVGGQRLVIAPIRGRADALKLVPRRCHLRGSDRHDAVLRRGGVEDDRAVGSPNRRCAVWPNPDASEGYPCRLA